MEGAYPTLAERKAAEIARRREAVRALRERLSAHARARGGRYLLYGSAARDALRYDSDVDLLVDFPEALQSDAWRFAEEAAEALGVPADIRPLAWCSERFLAHVRGHWVDLS